MRFLGYRCCAIAMFVFVGRRHLPESRSRRFFDIGLNGVFNFDEPHLPLRARDRCAEQGSFQRPMTRGFCDLCQERTSLVFQGRFLRTW